MKLTDERITEIWDGIGVCTSIGAKLAAFARAVAAEQRKIDAEICRAKITTCGVAVNECANAILKEAE